MQQTWPGLQIRASSNIAPSITSPSELPMSLSDGQTSQSPWQQQQQQHVHHQQQLHDGLHPSPLQADLPDTISAWHASQTDATLQQPVLLQQQQQQPGFQPLCLSKQLVPAGASAAPPWHTTGYAVANSVLHTAGPQQQQDQQQQQGYLQIAKCIAAAADQALMNQFTTESGSTLALPPAATCVYMQQPLNDVYTQLPGRTEEVIQWPGSNTFRPHSRLAFHAHLPQISSRALSKAQTAAECVLLPSHEAAMPNISQSDRVFVSLSHNVGGPKGWPTPTGVGEGYCMLLLPGQTKIEIFTKELDAAEDHAGAAASSISKRKRKPGKHILLEVFVEFERLLIFRSDKQQREALLRLQLTDAGPYWRQWQSPTGNSLWLACVGLNTFTGKELRRQPADSNLPALRLINSASPEQAIYGQQQQQLLLGQQHHHKQQQPSECLLSVSQASQQQVLSPAAVQPLQTVPADIWPTPATALCVTAQQTDQQQLLGCCGAYQGRAPPPAGPEQSAAVIAALDAAADHIGGLVQQQQQQPAASLPHTAEEEHDADLFNFLLDSNAVAENLLSQQWHWNQREQLGQEIDVDGSRPEPDLPAAAAETAAAAAAGPATSLAADSFAAGTLAADDEGPELPLLLDSYRQLDTSCPSAVRQLSDLADQASTLKHKFLGLCAGMYGANSTLVAQQLLQQIQGHNWSAVYHRRGDMIISPLQLKEDWFLERSPLHLLVSNVRVWGPAAEQTPASLMPADQRVALLKLLPDMVAGVSHASISSSSSAMGQLLSARNRNNASPWFSACHFCLPEVLEFLTAQPEMTWKEMLTHTKRGKLFYHIISTQSHIAESASHRQQLEQGMRRTLTALADSLQRDLMLKTPQQIQRLKQSILAVRQQRQRDRQQELRQQVTEQQPRRVWQWPVTLPDLPVSRPPLGLVHGSVHGINQSSPDDALLSGRSSGALHGPRLNPRWTDDVLWILHNYCIFHTVWHSPRSPPYNGQLLEAVAAELFGPTFIIRGPND